MPTHFERDRYRELTPVLNKYGVCHKNRDGIICPTCHNTVVPSSGGVPDYTWFINGFGTVIEMKGGADRISFSQITTDQREHLGWWQDKTGGSAWIAITTGEGRVISKDPLRKRMWMFTWDAWNRIEREISMTESVKYIPVVVSPSMRYKSVHTLNSMTHEELVWNKGGFDIPPTHKIVSLYGTMIDKG